MRTLKRLTTGSNRSLRSLGRAKACPLTKRYAQSKNENHESIGQTPLIVIDSRRFLQGYGFLSESLSSHNALV